MTTKSSKEEPIIQVKHISKHYNIGMDRTYKTLSGSITDAVRSPVKTLKGIGKQYDSFWALKDINFEVERGEVLGIIGRNGAGKSTLLKILSRITSPTEGEIRLRGRVGSLLEVGTGFHPELTGRENIYFNGAILGMKKREIDDKFDEIVKFSGVEKFLDTPVKRYSSGMNVRLAFSVAANLDPEILIIDEVLAVGDAEFQKKCLGKMGEVAEGGRTVLFVSHNMGAINRLCDRGILLSNGMIYADNSVKYSIERYLESNSNVQNEYEDLRLKQRRGGYEKAIYSAHIEDSKGRIVNSIMMGEKFKVIFEFTLKNRIDFMSGGIVITNQMGSRLFALNNYCMNNCFYGGNKGKFIAEVDENPLLCGKYEVNLSISNGEIEIVDWIESAISFTVEENPDLLCGNDLNKLNVEIYARGRVLYEKK